MMRNFYTVCLALFLVGMTGATLTGCAGKAARPQSVSISRTLPESMTDIGIERQVQANLKSILGLTATNHRVAIDSYRGDLLLTGEVPSEITKRAIEAMARSIKEVKKVHNRLKVSDEPKSKSHTVHENYLKTKYLAKLMTSGGGIKKSQYHVVVRDDIVYMMGTLTVDQARLASSLARETDGIMGFVSLMTVLAASTEELSRATSDNNAQNNTQNYGQNSGQVSSSVSIYSP